MKDHALTLPSDKLPIEDLRALWLAAFGTPPSPTFTRLLLARAVAWKMQVDVHGDISASTRLEMQKIVEHVRAGKHIGAAPRPVPMPPATILKPGAQLVRVWRGTTHIVDVTSEGFVWSGQTFGSLSAVAREITGSRWNGLVFFGLRDRPARGRKAADRWTKSAAGSTERKALRYG